MRKIFTLFYSLTLLLGSFTVHAQAISEDNLLKLKKVDGTHQELAFTIEDALKLVRFFTSKADVVASCHSDLMNNTLKVTGQEDAQLSELLIDPDFNAELLVMGYFIEIEGETTIARPAVSSNTVMPLEEDCDECTEVKINKNLVDYVMDKAGGEGDGELIFDFGSDGFNDPFGSFNDMDDGTGTEEEFLMPTTQTENSGSTLDSLIQIINAQPDSEPVFQDLEIIDEK